MDPLCMAFARRITEQVWPSVKAVPSVPKLKDGVCPVCGGTEPLNLEDWELWTDRL